jgi:hypothetical protein
LATGVIGLCDGFAFGLALGFLLRHLERGLVLEREARGGRQAADARRCRRGSCSSIRCTSLPSKAAGEAARQPQLQAVLAEQQPDAVLAVRCSPG